VQVWIEAVVNVHIDVTNVDGSMMKFTHVAVLQPVAAILAERSGFSMQISTLIEGGTVRPLNGSHIKSRLPN